MCRFMVYVSAHRPVTLSDLIVWPAHSIVKQSSKSLLRQEGNLNGDGFGIGWYSHEASPSSVHSSSSSTSTLPPSPSPSTSSSSASLSSSLSTSSSSSTSAAGTTDSSEQSSSRFAPSRSSPTVASDRHHTGASDSDSHGEDRDDHDETEDGDTQHLEEETGEPGRWPADREKPRSGCESQLCPYGEGQNPCVFNSVTPAWNNQNLHRIAYKVKSHLVFAHVRAATAGSLITESNCHPFQWGNYLWMHNGMISGFSKVKRRILNFLCDTLFACIQGSTDSEHLGLMFLQILFSSNHQGKDCQLVPEDFSRPYTATELRLAFEKTLITICQWTAEAGIEKPSLLNCAITDGRSVLVSRFVNSAVSEGATLYYNSGSQWQRGSEPGSTHYHMRQKDRRQRSHIISSEPLTNPSSPDVRDWIPVPKNSIVVIDSSCLRLVYPLKWPPASTFDVSSSPSTVALFTPTSTIPSLSISSPSPSSSASSSSAPSSSSAANPSPSSSALASPALATGLSSSSLVLTIPSSSSTPLSPVATRKQTMSEISVPDLAAKISLTLSSPISAIASSSISSQPTESSTVFSSQPFVPVSLSDLLS